ncbi:ATP-binding protein [Streptomyces sp. JV176]|uniref:ATP-binding protein n=1 Tax=Streptomyces sp. JV176 TaxID=858630 RepID=UPI002E79A90F|nr:ATP-binding protein [Streptomyces sp. JV176]MEE1804306.1 ATP-binding protein [Streptomyces sp. JV176]
MVGLIDTADGARAEWTFPAEPDTVRTARHAVYDTLSAWGAPASLRDLAVLLVSELVTNSQRYTSGPIGVRLAVHALAPAGAGAPGSAGGAGDADGAAGAAGPDAALLVEVSDPLPDPPTERLAGPEDEGGRGLRLVACSARRWGTRRGKTGKTVWFELSLPG